MNGDMGMLQAITMKAPPGKIPDGMKVTTIQGPNTGASAAMNVALAVGGFTLWPFSYYDNRVSFGMVMYDVQGDIVASIEKPGARYIYKITKNPDSGPSGAVTFWGQADQTIVMSLDEICMMMCGGAMISAA